MEKKIREIFLKICLLLIVLLFIINLLTKRFMYFQPTRDFLSVEETYKVIKHAHLHGWLAEGLPGSKIILICHSNKHNVSHNIEPIENLKRLGFTVLAFDYSGFGKSEGIPSEQQLYEDASYMVALLRQTYQPRQIVLYGIGLGASVATYAARRYDIPTLILVSPFPDAGIIVNKTPLKYISALFSEFQTLEYLIGYRGRSLMIHSIDDEIVPYSSTLDIQRSVTLHIPASGSHKNTQIPWEKIKQFIDN